MEKFEFFPIKCRSQRASEIYKTAQEEHSLDSPKNMKMKVHFGCCNIQIF